MMSNWWRVLAVLSLLAFSLGKDQSLPALNVDIQQTSVSGLSSGGFFAVQMHIAYSSLMVGSGIFAGGPYNCAEGQLGKALGSCMQGTPSPNINDLVTTTNSRAASGVIDDPTNLAQDKIFMFSGTDDTTVHPAVMKALYNYYTAFTDESNIQFEDSLKAAHTQPTINHTMNSCTRSASPYISYCDYDGAGIALTQIYGNLTAPNRGTLSGQLLSFDQSEFLNNPGSQSIASTGYVYVPASCSQGASCKLHVAFHGCLQDAGDVGLDYVTGAGYNAWADTNNMVILYPQTKASQVSPSNPNACWNWWGYCNDPQTYDTQQGSQMNMVYLMIQKIGSSFVTIASPTNLTVSSTTESSVSLQWKPVSQATGYNVLRGGVKINTKNITQTSYTDSTVQSGSFYSYEVVSVQGSAISAPSSPVLAHTSGSPPPLGAPKNLGAVAGSTSVVLSWEAASGALAYAVYRDGNQVGGSVRTTFNDTGLDATTTYTYQVAGVRQQTVGPMSNSVAVTTKSDYVCTTVTASNYAHVQAGRAYEEMGITYAKGSDQEMGLYNTFIQTTLSETSPDYWVIGACPLIN